MKNGFFKFRKITGNLQTKGEIVEGKKCNKCGEYKNFEEFYKNKNMKDGHRNECNDCRRKIEKERYKEKTKGHVKSYGKKTTEQYKQDLKNKKIEVIPLEEYKGRYTEIKHKCACGNEWLVQPHSVLEGTKCGCKDLKHKNYLKELKNKKIKVIPIEQFQSYNKEILHRCICGNEWPCKPRNVLLDARCGCKGMGGQLSNEQYLQLLKDKKIKVKPLEKYQNMNTPILHKCVCGNVWPAYPRYVLEDLKCGCMVVGRKFEHERYIKDLKQKKIKVIPLEEYKGIDEKILHKCVCGNEWPVKPRLVKLGIKCGCVKSKGETIIKKWLRENKVNYIQQFYIPTSSVKKRGQKRKYDIYIPSHNLIVEIHGLQHYEYVEHFFKTEKAFLRRQGTDRKKRELAEWLGYKYMEVDFREHKPELALERFIKAFSQINQKEEQQKQLALF